MNDPRFTDRQLSALIRRAAEAQAAEDEGSHTLAEIQAIAAEVGISPAVIAELATQVAPEPVNRWPSIFGPSALELARLVTGAPSIYVPELLETIRAATGHAGEAQQIAS